VTEVLASDEFADAVEADEMTASALGATGVPFFVLDRRYGISGAQPAEVILSALEQASAPAPA
jgi:predicted DsbA family dithiol-disulfide isomerase